MLKFLILINILVILFQSSLVGDEKSIQLILSETKGKNIDINDKIFMKSIEDAYSLFWQSEDKSDADKIRISLDLLELLQPFMKNENDIGKIESVRNLVLSNLRVANNDKKLNDKKIEKLESIIGSNEYKCLFINKAKIGTYVRIQYVEPIGKTKEFTNQNDIELGELSLLCNEIDFYLFDKEKAVENKLALIIATFELSNKINGIIKNETDQKKKGWYTVINKTLRENSLKYLVEFQADTEKNKIVEKHLPTIKKQLVESEIKSLEKK